MRKNIYAFTFVELIVVITIMAILSTIGFTVYQDYLSSSRDSNRIVQLSDIHDGLELMSAKTKLPFPEDYIEISANNNTFSYQGDAGKSVLQAIGYDGGGYDPEYAIPFTYMLSKGGRDFQLLGFVSDSSFVTYSFDAYADEMDYVNFFPKVIGSPLGVMIEKDTQIPINKLTSIVSSRYDIILGSENTLSYFSDTQFFDSTQDDLTQMIPNKDCKRIVELGNAKGNGKYLISPTGSGTLQVYCEMETEGGGWTFAGHIDGTSFTSDISFSSAVGVYDVDGKDTGDTYFLDMSQFPHTEMMALINTKSAGLADSTNSFLMLSYGADAPMFHTADLTSCTSPLGASDVFFHKTQIGGEYTASSVGNCGASWTIRPQDYSPPGGPSGQYLLYTRQSSPGGTRWGPDAWRWLNNEWDGISAANTFGNDVWIYIR